MELALENKGEGAHARTDTHTRTHAHIHQVHVESADIITWIDQTFDGPSLVPQDEGGKKAMQELAKGPCSRVVSTGLGFVAGESLQGWALWQLNLGFSSWYFAGLAEYTWQARFAESKRSQPHTCI
eukprot:1142831-Pelagomonas_calceolata.AAC.5